MLETLNGQNPQNSPILHGFSSAPANASDNASKRALADTVISMGNNTLVLQVKDTNLDKVKEYLDFFIDTSGVDGEPLCFEKPAIKSSQSIAGTQIITLNCKDTLSNVLYLLVQADIISDAMAIPIAPLPISNVAEHAERPEKK